MSRRRRKEGEEEKEKGEEGLTELNLLLRNVIETQRKKMVC